MTPEAITAYATAGTVVVIGASAIAALVQLRHMRASNQLEGLLSLEADFRSPAVQNALHYVQQHLPERLEDPAYRKDLSTIGFVNTDVHPELIACNWFNAMGTLLKHGLISEETFMDLFSRLIRYYWRALAPVIAIMRRSRGAGQYHDFEYLAIRADQWLRQYPEGVFPKRLQRLTLPDPWREQDAAVDEGR
ncbi:MAG TPA: hypothetical protein VFE17_11495 [Candidatus Baltobacteraceae bacterium]|nr:hypothetical protein [Candidatus Baltobacteraceae bacterium]